MAKLTNEDVLKLAKLSRLDLDDKEVEKFAQEITAILGYVEQLQELDLKDYAPTYQVSGLTNVMRADTPAAYEASRQDLLNNLPASEGSYIKVKRMIQ